MATEETTIPAELLAKWSGMTEPELNRAIRATVKLVDGKYPATAAIKATLAYFRDQVDFISNTELSEVYGCTTGRVSNMAREGILKQDGKGRYPRRQTIVDLFAHMRARLGEGATTAGQAKNHARNLANRLLEIQVKKQEGRAFDREDVFKAWSHLVLLCREKLLRIGNKIAPRWAYLKSEGEAEEVIRQEIEEALTELSKPMDYLPPTTQNE